MDLLAKIVVAIVCATVANILVPRRIPGGLTGLVLTGLAGIWLGRWTFALFQQAFGIDYAFLYWQVQGILIVPAIVGCAIVLFVGSALLRWWRFG